MYDWTDFGCKDNKINNLYNFIIAFTLIHKI